MARTSFYTSLVRAKKKEKTIQEPVINQVPEIINETEITYTEPVRGSEEIKEELPESNTSPEEVTEIIPVEQKLEPELKKVESEESDKKVQSKKKSKKEASDE